MDFQNAFNSLSRECMPRELFSLPELKPFFSMAHWPTATGHSSRQGKRVRRLHGFLPRKVYARGVLGSLLFAAATLSILERAKNLDPLAEVHHGGVSR